MNKRIAKITLKWGYLIGDPLCEKAQDYLDKSHSTAYWQSLHLVRQIKSKTTTEDQITTLIKGWAKLRSYVVRKVPNRDREGDTQEWGITVFNDKLSQYLNSEKPLKSLLVEKALSDLSYYSDRWCRWRLFYIDELINKLERIK